MLPHPLSSIEHKIEHWLKTVEARMTAFERSIVLLASEIEKLTAVAKLVVDKIDADALVLTAAETGPDPKDIDAAIDKVKAVAAALDAVIAPPDTPHAAEADPAPAAPTPAGTSAATEAVTAA